METTWTQKTFDDEMKKLVGIRNLVEKLLSALSLLSMLSA